jgi:flap endonuclease-1
MGVKLQDLILKKIVGYQELAGSIIAVDAPNIIMGLFNFARKNPDGSKAELILDRTQRPISHLYGLLYRVNFLYSKKIFPIFCFDGKISEMKRIITKDQLNDFRFVQKWYQEAIKNGDKRAAREIASSREYMWQNVIDESKQLLGALGIPYVESPASAESQCAYLVKKRIAHYSNSQDYDSLLFGCPFLIQNLSKTLRRKVQGKWTYNKITPVSISLEKSLESLEITYFQLIDVGILAGTDYFPGINGLGSKRALTLIKKYNQLEKIISEEGDKHDFSKLTPEIINNIRKLFLFPNISTSINNFQWNCPTKSSVLKLLCQEHFLNKERVENNLVKLVTNYKKCKEYFQKALKTPKSVQLTLDNLLK